MALIRKWLVLICLVAGSGVCSAAAVWLEGINVLYEKNESSAFNISLGGRFQIVATRTNKGKTCAVVLQQIPPMQGVEKSTNILNWQPSVLLPLQKVSSEGNAVELSVHLHFVQPVMCTFQISGSHDSLWISVQRQKSDSEKQQQEQLFKARSALAANNISAAISLYQDVYKRSSIDLIRQEALEYLGVCYERLKDFKRARQTYQLYLNTYSEAEGAARVAQRLQGIELMFAQPKPELRALSRKTHNESMRWYGVYSNSYQYYGSDQGENDWLTLQSAWLTDLNLNGRYRSEQVDLKLQLSTGFEHDFNQDIAEPYRLSSGYADLFYKPSTSDLRVGRQSTHGEGVLSKYDGIHLNQGLGSLFALNGVWGYPVMSSRDVDINTDSQLYGGSLDIRPATSPWRGNLFFNQQTSDTWIERQAVGAELDYQQPQQNWMGYLDYDLKFNELNAVNLNANWFDQHDSHAYLTLDYRRSPTLSLSNALIGQTLTELGQLEALGLSETELQEVALDRSAISQSAMAGISRRFQPHWRWATDVSLWQLSGTADSLGVEGYDGTDLETNVSGQLLGNDLLQQRDLLWMTLRYADLTSSNLYSVAMEYRFFLDRQWQLRPKVQLYWRDFTEVSGSELSVRPSFKLEYKPARQWNIELNLSGEWTDSEQHDLSTRQVDFLGYIRVDWLF